MTTDTADRRAALKALFKDAMDWGRSYGQRLNLSAITIDDVSEQFAEKALATLAKQQACEPCSVCNALIAPRNATRYDEADLAAARVRGRLIAASLNVEQQAVANGANSVSMPEEYVEIAAWLSTCKLSVKNT